MSKKLNDKEIVERVLGSDAEGRFAFARLAIYFAVNTKRPSVQRWCHGSSKSKRRAKRATKDARAMIVQLYNEGHLDPDHVTENRLVIESLTKVFP